MDLFNAILSIMFFTLTTIGSNEVGSESRSLNDDYSNISKGRITIVSGNLEGSKNEDVNSDIEGKANTIKAIIKC